MLDRLIDAGIKYVFVSNSDNLGATLDVNLLTYFAESDKSFVMEVGACPEALETSLCPAKLHPHQRHGANFGEDHSPACHQAFSLVRMWVQVA
jgi:hypothetical protein